jgi:nitric oxide reductase large subunit
MRGIILRCLSAIWLVLGVPGFLILPLLIKLHVSINNEILWIEYAFLKASLGTLLNDPEPSNAHVAPLLSEWHWWMMIFIAAGITSLVGYYLARTRYTKKQLA